MATLVVVLTFDIPDDQAEVHGVVKAIVEAKLPHIGPAVHLATGPFAADLLALFTENKDSP